MTRARRRPSIRAIRELLAVFFEFPLREGCEPDRVGAAGAERGFFVADFIAARPNIQPTTGWLACDRLPAGIAVEGRGLWVSNDARAGRGGKRLANASDLSTRVYLTAPPYAPPIRARARSVSGRWRARTGQRGRRAPTSSPARGIEATAPCPGFSHSVRRLRGHSRSRRAPAPRWLVG